MKVDTKLNLNLTFFVVVGLVLCILKVLKIVNISWFWCLLPFWIWFPLLIILIGLGYLLLLVNQKSFSKKFSKRLDKTKNK